VGLVVLILFVRFVGKSTAGDITVIEADKAKVEA